MHAVMVVPDLQHRLLPQPSEREYIALFHGEDLGLANLRPLFVVVGVGGRFHRFAQEVDEGGRWKWRRKKIGGAVGHEPALFKMLVKRQVDLRLMRARGRSLLVCILRSLAAV